VAGVAGGVAATVALVVVVVAAAAGADDEGTPTTSSSLLPGHGAGEGWLARAQTLIKAAEALMAAAREAGESTERLNVGSSSDVGTLSMRSISEICRRVRQSVENVALFLFLQFFFFSRWTFTFFLERRHSC
jgi:hypothetical protein